MREGNPKKLIDVGVEVLARRERAVHVKALYWAAPNAWFPTSQVELEENPSGSHTMTAPEWLLMEKGWL